MQKIFHALFFAIVFFNGSVYGMEKNIMSALYHDDLVQSFMIFNDRVVEYINKGIPNCQFEYGVTLLFIACQLGDLKSIQLLLDAKADVNLEADSGCTPLHVVSNRGNLEAVKLLLAAGADVRLKNARRQTPLQLAQKRGYTEIVKIIQEQVHRENLEWKKAKLAKRRTC
jgi:ankyrin repeat protein